MKCDFCSNEASKTTLIVWDLKYHACIACQSRVFKLIKRMIREYVKAGE